jgi:hypothetical protein
VARALDFSMGMPAFDGRWPNKMEAAGEEVVLLVASIKINRHLIGAGKFNGWETKLILSFPI